MKKKVAVIISIILIAIIGFFGYRYYSQNKESNKKVITVAMSGTYYPFTFKEGNNIEGFEVDVWNDIGKRLGYKVEYKTASFSGLFGMLDSGKVNTIANQITISKEREDKYYFTEPTVYTGAQIIVRNDESGVKSLSDLKGKTVGVDLGSNYEEMIKKADTNGDIDIKTYQDTNVAFNQLMLGRIDAVVIDRVSAAMMINKGNLPLKIVGKPIKPLENAYPFVKTPENKELITKINGAINAMRADGTLKAISEKWLKTNVTTAGDTDNVAAITGNDKINPTATKSSAFDILYAKEIFPKVLVGLKTTLIIAVVSMIIGLIIGLILSIIRVYKVPVLKQIVEVYISFFRGTPLLVQLFLLYFGLPQIIPELRDMSAYFATIIGLGLNSSAYIAEVLRSSIDAIDDGQMEACYSLGMTRAQGLRRIVLPQAFRIAIPPLGNVFIDNIKSSSLAFTLGVVEILAQAQMIAAASYRFFEPYVIAALIYWAVILFFSFLQRRLEKKLSVY
ncbi:MAG: ABC transporter permease subunit [Sarcina sp.]